MKRHRNKSEIRSWSPPPVLEPLIWRKQNREQKKKNNRNKCHLKLNKYRWIQKYFNVINKFWMRWRHPKSVRVKKKVDRVRNTVETGGESTRFLLLWDHFTSWVVSGQRGCVRNMVRQHGFRTGQKWRLKYMHRVCVCVRSREAIDRKEKRVGERKKKNKNYKLTEHKTAGLLR